MTAPPDLNAPTPSGGVTYPHHELHEVAAFVGGSGNSRYQQTIKVALGRVSLGPGRHSRPQLRLKTWIHNRVTGNQTAGEVSILIEDAPRVIAALHAGLLAAWGLGWAGRRTIERIQGREKALNHEAPKIAAQLVLRSANPRIPGDGSGSEPAPSKQGASVAPSPTSEV